MAARRADSRALSVVRRRSGWAWTQARTASAVRSDARGQIASNSRRTWASFLRVAGRARGSRYSRRASARKRANRTGASMLSLGLLGRGGEERGFRRSKNTRNIYVVKPVHELAQPHGRNAHAEQPRATYQRSADPSSPKRRPTEPKVTGSNPVGCTDRVGNHRSAEPA